MTERLSLPLNLVFDLDGTLVDSAPAILAAFASTLARHGIEPIQPLGPHLIGPKLQDTLRQLSGSNDPLVLDQLSAGFKQHYDQNCAAQTLPYPGVPNWLSTLHSSGAQLFLATNKRILPTRRILDHLEWSDYFEGIHALDSFEPPLASKTELIGQVLRRHRLDSHHTLYIGDREEDGEAASSHGIRFVLVSWGYGPPRPAHETLPAGWQTLDHPSPSALLGSCPS